jgi:hypothetical protein
MIDFHSEQTKKLEISAHSHSVSGRKSTLIAEIVKWSIDRREIMMGVTIKL